MHALTMLDARLSDRPCPVKPCRCRRMPLNLDDAVGRPNGLPPLWNHLISLRLESAAVGMLHDLFQGVAYGEAKMRGRVGQILHAGIREEAMELVGDTDGTVLKAWLDAFRYDRLQFQRMAIEHVRACCRDQAD